MNRSIPLFAAFSLAAAIGWILGNPSEPAVEDHGTSQTVPPRPKSARFAKVEFATDPAFKESLEKIRTATTTKDRLQFTIDLARSIPDQDVEKWVKGKLFKEPDPALEGVFNNILFGRYSQIDPKECVTTLARMNYAVGPYAANWAALNFRDVLALAKITPEKSLRTALRTAGIAEMAKSDPAGALTVLSEEPDDFQVLSEVIPSIAAANRQLVLDWADQQSQDSTRSSVREKVARVHFESDFNGALTWAKAQPDGQRLIAMGAQSLKLPPSGYLDRIGSLPPDWTAGILASARKLPEHYDQWLNYDYAKAGLDAAQTRMVRMQVISRLAFLDPEKALAAAQTMVFGENVGSEVGPSVSRNFSFYNDMNRAFEAQGGDIVDRWKAALGEEGRQALRSFPQTTKINIPMAPDQAIHHLAAKDEILDSGFIQRWTHEELDVATTSIESVPPEQFENLYRLVDQPGEGVPVKLQSKVLTEAAKKDVKYSGSVYVDFAFKSAKDDPRAAADWTMALPEGYRRNFAVRGVAAQWNVRDPEAAKSWAKTLPPTEQKAAEEVIYHIHEKHPPR